MIGQPRQDAPIPETNPSNTPEKSTGARQRIPMSLPRLRLQVPDIPGYHCHWMRGEPQRLEQALKAGYEFVASDEVELNRTGLANGGMDSGNEDMGSRVSVTAGNDGVRLYLMKLPQAFWDDDVAAAAVRQEDVASQLRGDKGFGEAGMDTSLRYSRKEQANYLRPKTQTRSA